jgi:hypothetical protein
VLNAAIKPRRALAGSIPVREVNQPVRQIPAWVQARLALGNLFSFGALRHLLCLTLTTEI